jgi:hypothetical protein
LKPGSSKSIQKVGELWLNTFVFFQITTKVLTLAYFLQLLSFAKYFCHFLEITKKTPHLDENVSPISLNF